VLLNHAASAGELAQFDEVVLATGIDPRKPAIPGIDHKSVASYVDVLSGRVQPGKDVVIIGAGGIGFDVALYLLERNERSTLDADAFAQHWGIVQDTATSGGLDPRGFPAAHPTHRITMLKRSTTPFGNTLGRTTGWVHRAELARNGVKMLKGVEYRRIDDAGVHIAIEGKESVIPADTVVICAGQEPLRPVPAKHLIGGAREAGELDAKRAMREGAELGASL
jgi:2,4-dienoyl-CoA reductase (NADPH2)